MWLNKAEATCLSCRTKNVRIPSLTKSVIALYFIFNHELFTCGRHCSKCFINTFNLHRPVIVPSLHEETEV